jgi:hypothetical protein
VMTIFKVLLLSQTVLDQVESVMAIDLIWIWNWENLISKWWLWVRFSNNYHLIN